MEENGAIDWAAVESEGIEAERRKVALEQAVKFLFEGDAHEVIKTAEAFYNFLKGETQ